MGEGPMIDYSDRKEIGRSGEFVSAIGLGTWNIKNYKKALNTYSLAVEYGIDNIDTAEMYDGGRAEAFVGELIRKVGRENLFVTTKILPSRLNSKHDVIKAAKSSLRRMGISCADLFLIHWPNYSLPISEQIKNFEAIYTEGLARYIGVSNFDLKELQEAICSVKAAEIVVDQLYYSVINRIIEKELLPYCISQDITIQAYMPLERGEIFALPTLKEIGQKYEKTALQVSLNYLISHKRTVAIPKTENPNHLIEIAGSMGWRLSEKDLLSIKSLGDR